MNNKTNGNKLKESKSIEESKNKDQDLFKEDEEILNQNEKENKTNNQSDDYEENNKNNNILATNTEEKFEFEEYEIPPKHLKSSKKHVLSISDTNPPVTKFNTTKANSIISEEQFKRREELEKVCIRKTQANMFEKYLSDTGIAGAFELLFSELITKKIPAEDHYIYAAGRLRQIGREVESIKNKNK